MRLFLIAYLIAAGCSKPSTEWKSTLVLQVPTPVPAIVITPQPTPVPVADLPLLVMQKTRWNNATTRKEKLHFAQVIAEKIHRNESRYQYLSEHTGVPWDIIGSIHNMECGLSFREHLHNGDSLTAKTVHVPKGRPKAGYPPFTWEESALDAIRYDHLDEEAWGDVAHSLQNVEAYNGLGYEKYHQKVPTPYLWSWSTIYTRGKYVADGKWSDTAVSDQCGVVPILKELRNE
jgi:lysozyme family protein